MLTLPEYLLVTLAAMAAGLVNALAGGGTLITFPILMAVGLPAVSANVTNTVALSPGYFGATWAQRKDLKDQKKRLWYVMPAGAIGGLVGGLLLLLSTEKLFRDLVPFLILFASILLAIQEPVKRWMAKRNKQQEGHKPPSEAWVMIPVGIAAIYGGYFGAGMSVVVLAVLGLVLEDNLTRLNALKQSVAFATNVTAALFFVFSGQVNWLAALVMAVGALIGGSLGGRLAGKIKPSTLRMIVVVVGFVVSIIYFIRG